MRKPPGNLQGKKFWPIKLSRKKVGVKNQDFYFSKSEEEKPEKMMKN